MLAYVNVMVPGGGLRRMPNPLYSSKMPVSHGESWHAVYGLYGQQGLISEGGGRGVPVGLLGRARGATCRQCAAPVGGAGAELGRLHQWMHKNMARPDRSCSTLPMHAPPTLCGAPYTCLLARPPARAHSLLQWKLSDPSLCQLEGGCDHLRPDRRLTPFTPWAATFNRHPFNLSAGSSTLRWPQRAPDGKYKSGAKVGALAAAQQGWRPPGRAWGCWGPAGRLGKRAGCWRDMETRHSLRHGRLPACQPPPCTLTRQPPITQPQTLTPPPPHLPSHLRQAMDAMLRLLAGPMALLQTIALTSNNW